jgi:deazaflavin-dependent oxidoreductase (nitroreductase family)
MADRQGLQSKHDRFRDTLTPIVAFVGVLIVGLLAFAVVIVFGWRAKSPRVLNTLRRVIHATFNPRTMRSAGTPGAHVSVIRHIGRKSGRPHETPVGAVATEDGFLIAISYGQDTDWLKNVLASGSATVVNEGNTYLVDRPEVIPMEVAAARFSKSDRWGFRLLRIDRCLRVRRVGDPPASSS